MVLCPVREISIHAPRKGSDARCNAEYVCCKGFQSTPPARGATSTRGHIFASHRISIHALRKGSDCKSLAQVALNAVISIHARRKGATGVTVQEWISVAISIHAPRKGSDCRAVQGKRQCRNFNPRPPQGERRGYGLYKLYTVIFQSTPPARGATTNTFCKWFL